MGDGGWACSLGLLGPQLVIFTKDLTPPYLFAASYLGQAAFASARRELSSWRCFVHRAKSRPAMRQAGRPLSVIARQPRFIVGGGAVSRATR